MSTSGTCESRFLQRTDGVLDVDADAHGTLPTPALATRLSECGALLTLIESRRFNVAANAGVRAAFVISSG